MPNFVPDPPRKFPSLPSLLCHSIHGCCFHHPRGAWPGRAVGWRTRNSGMARCRRGTGPGREAYQMAPIGWLFKIGDSRPPKMQTWAQTRWSCPIKTARTRTKNDPCRSTAVPAPSYRFGPASEAIVKFLEFPSSNHRVSVEKSVDPIRHKQPARPWRSTMRLWPDHCRKRFLRGSQESGRVSFRMVTPSLTWPNTCGMARVRRDLKMIV
jgi:hypothetical protein